MNQTNLKGDYQVVIAICIFILGFVIGLLAAEGSILQNYESVIIPLSAVIVSIFALFAVIYDGYSRRINNKLSVMPIIGFHIHTSPHNEIN